MGLFRRRYKSHWTFISSVFHTKIRVELTVVGGGDFWISGVVMFQKDTIPRVYRREVRDPCKVPISSLVVTTGVRVTSVNVWDKIGRYT